MIDSAVDSVRRRTIKTLAASQIISGIGVAGAGPAGALLVMDVSGSEALSGLAQTFSVTGAALMAIPLAQLTEAGGRRLALMSGYTIGAAGTALAVLGGALRWLPLMLLGTLLVGAATASNYQTRFAAVDLSADEHRARDLSLVVWAGTVGSVIGPNLLNFSGSIAARLGLPTLTGPYLFAGTMLAIGVLIIFFALRPDPFKLAREISGHARRPARGHLRAGLTLIGTSADAKLALAAIVIGHIAMVSIMVMTPVHMRHVDVSLQIVGLVISVHIFGMFALSPVMGWLSDRFGRIWVIKLGVGILSVSALVAGVAAADDAVTLGIGLFLLGLGWSATLVAGSTLLAESLPIEERPRVQGTSDLLMNGAGALGGAVAGVIIAVSSYAILCLAAALPVVWLGIAAMRHQPVKD